MGRARPGALRARGSRWGARLAKLEREEVSRGTFLSRDGVLTRLELGATRCPDPTCVESHAISINAPCHPNAGLSLWYDPDSTAGLLMIECSVCEATIAGVLVADREIGTTN